MEAEPNACILIVRGANGPEPQLHAQVGRFVAGIDYAADDGYGAMTFTDVWREAQRFESAEEAQAFVVRRSPVRPTIDGRPHHPAMTWSYRWAWASDFVDAETRMEVVDAVADAIAHEGSWH